MVTPSPSVPVSFANASVGAFGATVSTVIVTGSLVLPASSVAVTLTSVPSANGASGVTDQRPSTSASRV